MHPWRTSPLIAGEMSRDVTVPVWSGPSSGVSYTLRQQPWAQFGVGELLGPCVSVDDALTAFVAPGAVQTWWPASAATCGSHTPFRAVDEFDKHRCRSRAQWRSTRTTRASTHAPSSSTHRRPGDDGVPYPGTSRCGRVTDVRRPRRLPEVSGTDTSDRVIVDAELSGIEPGREAKLVPVVEVWGEVPTGCPTWQLQSWRNYRRDPNCS